MATSGNAHAPAPLSPGRRAENEAKHFPSLFSAIGRRVEHVMKNLASLFSLLGGWAEDVAQVFPQLLVSSGPGAEKTMANLGMCRRFAGRDAMEGRVIQRRLPGPFVSEKSAQVAAQTVAEGHTIARIDAAAANLAAIGARNCRWGERSLAGGKAGRCQQ